MSDANNPFDNLQKKIKTIKVGKDEVKVRLKTKDAGKVLLLMKNEMNETDADRISDIILRMLRLGNPDIDEEALDDYASEHFSDIFIETNKIILTALKKIWLLKSSWSPLR
jgi:hypothetical protein